MLGVTFFYIRQMIRIGEVAMSAVAVARRRRTRRRPAACCAASLLNLAGLVVFVVMIFPVYWMVATAFKPGVEITSYTPDVDSRSTRRSSTSPTRSTRRTSGTT